VIWNPGQIPEGSAATSPIKSDSLSLRVRHHTKQLWSLVLTPDPSLYHRLATLGGNMPSHPYISGVNNVTQMLTFLRKNFPPTVSADTVKRLGLAPKNESYVINVLQYLKLIDEDSKRTEAGHNVMTIHDDAQFREAFNALTRDAYADLFELHGDEAWSMTRSALIHFFRSADKTSDIIGQRQAGVFLALREFGGHQSGSNQSESKPKTTAPIRVKSTVKSKKVDAAPVDAAKVDPPSISKNKGDMALTVRIEINLPSEGSQETYDAIFKSIRSNLFP
jgi:hypothetical protein